MEQQIFTNEVILSWLQYYAKNTTLDLEHVKIIDITKKHLPIGEEEMFCVKRLFPSKKIPTKIPYFIIKLKEVK